ncbi:MAG: hypothetical protein IJ523_04905 [Succinivibrionaceae bacterium]|nr:hypothetical protein [Succinivibrionaceae bacterium]
MGGFVTVVFLACMPLLAYFVSRMIVTVDQPLYETVTPRGRRIRREDYYWNLLIWSLGMQFMVTVVIWAFMAIFIDDGGSSGDSVFYLAVAACSYVMLSGLSSRFLIRPWLAAAVPVGTIVYAVLCAVWIVMLDDAGIWSAPGSRGIDRDSFNGFLFLYWVICVVVTGPTHPLLRDFGIETLFNFGFHVVSEDSEDGQDSENGQASYENYWTPPHKPYRPGVRPRPKPKKRRFDAPVRERSLDFLETELAGNEAWYFFDDASNPPDPTLAMQGFSAWNEKRFETLRSAKPAKDLLDALFLAMGFAGSCSTSNEIMQQICFDEMMFQLGLDEDGKGDANQAIERGRSAAPEEIKRSCGAIADALSSVSADSIRTVFGAATAILFYDELLSEKERQVFYTLARYFRLDKKIADSVFADFLSLFSLERGPGDEDFVYSPGLQSRAGQARSDRDSGGRQDGARGQPEGAAGAEGARERRDSFEQENEKAFRRQQEEMRRQRESQERQQEERRRFEEERKRQRDRFRRQQEEERRRQQKEKRRSRWWWNSHDDDGDAEPTMSLKEAYLTLQCGHGDSDSQVKQAWRRLVARYHPDKASARGAGDEEVARYNAMTARINAAYDVIRKDRNL